MCSGAGGADNGGQDWYQTRSEEELLAYQQPVNRPMYDGEGNQLSYVDENGQTVYRYEENPDYNLQQQEYQEAQTELQRRALVRDRETAFAAVTQQQQEMQQQQQAEIQRQGELQAQVGQDRLAQEEQIGRERMAGQAMSQSMQVLGRAGKTTAAPVAQVTRRTQSRSTPRATSGSQGLRIGSSVTAPGTGLNIGG